MPPYQAIQPDFQNMLAQRLGQGVQPQPMRPVGAPMPFRPVEPIRTFPGPQNPVQPGQPVGPVARPFGPPDQVQNPIQVTGPFQAQAQMPMNGTAPTAGVPNAPGQDMAAQNVLRQRLGMGNMPAMM